MLPYSSINPFFPTHTSSPRSVYAHHSILQAFADIGPFASCNTHLFLGSDISHNQEISPFDCQMYQSREKSAFHSRFMLMKSRRVAFPMAGRYLYMIRVLDLHDNVVNVQ